MTETLHHWAGGARSTARRGRVGDVIDPATGEVTAPRPVRLGREVDSRRSPPRRPRSRPGATPRWPGARAILFRFRELLDARAGELAEIITAEHGKVLVRRRRRGGPRPGGRRVRLRHRRTCSRARRPRTPRRASTCTRSASRSASVGGSSARSTSRRWCRCGSSPSRSPPATRWCSSRRRRCPSAALWMAELWREAGLPDGVFNVLHGDKVAVDGLLTHPGRQERSASSARPRSPATSTRPAPRTASACRRSAARRTTWSCCPTPTSTWPPTRPSTPGSARPASGAWRSPRWSRSATSPTTLVGQDRRAGPRRCAPATAVAAATWARW